MEAILVKVFATALALSLVTARPDAVKTQFDPVRDRTEVIQVLREGCTYLKKAFDIENIDLDDLIATVMTDKQAGEGEALGFRGVKFADLHLAYRQLCKSERTEREIIDVGQVIEFYNNAATDLPDHERLKGIKLPGLTNVLDGRGTQFAELYEPENRRRWIPLSEIPQHVQQAFIAAEDKRFFQHRGVDERSVIRAFMNMIADPGKRQGGSTITQQVAKNLLVGDDITYERKIREIIVANRVEKAISKQEILEIYLNSIFLGRSSWGIELAAQGYFGKSAKDLTIAEGAFLSGLTKGPNYYNPDRYRGRAQERLAYVLGRMHEDGVINDEQLKQAESIRLTMIPYVRPRRDNGYHFVDHIGREAKTLAGIDRLTATSYVVRSTIQPDIQRTAEAALQEGLAAYERGAGRIRFQAAEANLSEAIRRVEADPKADHSKPAWRTALENARKPLYDVHWDTAVVLEKGRGGGDAIQVGLRDGRILPLSTIGADARRNLVVHDLIFVKVIETTNRQGRVNTRVELRWRPTVQAATVVIENKTGRVLAMVGGFSYPLSQLNRVTQSRRQPGSSFKPMTYLAALSHGLQPNTLVQDAPITLPPIHRNRYSQAKDWWSPRNYDGGFSGTMTLRRALEQSKNVATARLLEGGIEENAPESLDAICRLAMEAQLYTQCERFYPFLLGAQPVRPIDLAAFYAAVANEGELPVSHVIQSIERDGKIVYREKLQTTALGSADKPAVFQLKTLLQGVVARGTAARMAANSAFIGGKTGTSDDFNDAWFVGFSNDVTIAVWVGYDNAKGKRTLGPKQAGSRVAVPIFEPIMQSVWANYAPKTPLSGPSPEAARHLMAVPIDVRSGEQLPERSRGAFIEYFRLDASGQVAESQYRLVSRSSAHSGGDPEYTQEPRGGLFGGFPFGGFGGGGGPFGQPRGRDDFRRDTDNFFPFPFFQQQQQQPQQQQRGQRQAPPPGYAAGRRPRGESDEQQRQRRNNGQDFFFGGPRF